MLIGKSHKHAILFRAYKIFQDIVNVAGKAVEMKTHDRINSAFINGINHILQARTVIGLSTLIVAVYRLDLPARLIFCNILTAQFFLCGERRTLGVFIARDADIDRCGAGDVRRLVIHVWLWSV